MNGKYDNAGLLLIRVGIGAVFLYYGFPSLMAGPSEWSETGKSMSALNITFLPAFWGFLIALAEVLGSIFFIFGILFKTACSSLLFVMIVTLFNQGDILSPESFALQTAVVLLGLLFVGPGSIRFSSK